jgi:hypothetical protein
MKYFAAGVAAPFAPSLTVQDRTQCGDKWAMMRKTLVAQAFAIIGRGADRAPDVRRA